MSPLDRLVKSSYWAIFPGVNPPTCGATKFRWEMHVALPFCLPIHQPIERQESVEGRSYDFCLTNFVDRVVTLPASSQAWPSVGLIPRTRPTPAPKQGERIIRETLQSVAWYADRCETSDPAAAFNNAKDKAEACFRHLSETLSRIQRSMPYLVSWQVYPLSQFDVGLVYHRVSHWCPNTRRWDHVATGLLMNLARQLHKPLCRIDFDEKVALPPSLELSHELLAEAQVALFRGLFRTTVLNSYQAVESFANHVFEEKKTSALVTEGNPEAIAREEAEKLRRSNNNNVKIEFLVHRGLKEAGARSLCEDDQKIYIALLQLKKLRNLVAHAGRKPTQNEAEDGYALCCNVVRWLSEVGGYPVRALIPEASNIANEAISLPSDINAIPGAGKAFLLWALGHAACTKGLEQPYQPSLEMKIGNEGFKVSDAGQQ